MPKQERGIALITAMIITTIAVSLAGMIMYRQQVQIRLSSNIGHFEQAYLYVNGMEDWAGTILEKSYKDHPHYDSLGDDWNNNGNDLVLPITGGLMTGKLHDLQARINLNSLKRPKEDKKNLTSSGPSSESSESSESSSDTNSQNSEEDVETDQYVYPAEVTRQRLVNLLTNEVDPNQEMGSPEDFTDVLKDWIDDDQDNGNREKDDGGNGNGAESPYYQTQDPAYYSADSEFLNLTELRLLKGMKEVIYKKLIEHTSALPITDNNESLDTPININTAKLPVLIALGFTPDVANEIIQQVRDTPFESIKDFTESSLVKNDIKSEDSPDSLVDPDQLSVTSRFFLLQGKVEINNARILINSILERKEGKVSVIMRDFSNPQSITKAVN